MSTSFLPQAPQAPLRFRLLQKKTTDYEIIEIIIDEMSLTPQTVSTVTVQATAIESEPLAEAKVEENGAGSAGCYT
jgi:hypothetical protein